MPSAEPTVPAPNLPVKVDILSSAPVDPAPAATVPVSQGDPWSVEKALAHFGIPIPSSPETSPLAFFHLVERLKTTSREGWRRFRIGHGESISDHMYRMSIITMLAPPTLATELNVPRCTKMALVHDMAEALVGDITPMDKISKEEKSRREASTIEFLTTRLLGGPHSEQAADIRSAWWEYETGKTKDAMFVKDVDKLELLLQMVEYERTANGEVDLGEFAHVAGAIKLEEMRHWSRDILLQREAFWAALGNKTKSGKEPENIQLRTELGW